MGWWTLDGVSEEEVRLVQEEHGKFQSAIGSLTLDWADLERVLRRTLRYYAGVSPGVGRALFSGTRAKGVIDFINSIAHNTNMPEDRLSDLKDIFQAIGPINTMRDFIVHHVDGSTIESNSDDPRVRKVSSADASSRIGNGKTLWIGSALIQDMCADITECCWRLQAHWEPTNTPFQRGVGPTGLPQPWRFKTPQPI